MTQSKSREKLYNAINGSAGVEVKTEANGGLLTLVDLAFTGQPADTETFVINGTTFTFTTGASTTTNINIKGTLALTLAEAELVIESNTDMDAVLMAVDVTNTDADLTLEFRPNVTAVVTEAIANVASVSTVTTGTACGHLNPQRSATYFEIGSPGAVETYVLPNGTYDGQVKELYVVSSGDSSDLQIVGNFATGAICTLGGAAADGMTVYWDRTNQVWKSTKATNATFATRDARTLA